MPFVSTNSGMKLVSVGEATADFYPQLGQTFAGGISLNFAVQAKRHGAASVSLVSRVGEDEAAKMILNYLATAQVDRSRVVVQAGKTAVCSILVQPNGERVFPPNSYHQHVLAEFVPNAADLAFIRQHEVLVARFDISYTKVGFDLVMRELPFAGQRVADFGDWFDYVGQEALIWPYLKNVDLAFLSGNEATITAVLPHSYGRTLWVVTLGAAGSVAVKKGKIIPQGALPVAKIVDTTGCGDAFQAAFTVCYLKTADIAKALFEGATQAAKTLQHYGAT